jgi:hypothetical protein
MVELSVGTLFLLLLLGILLGMLAFSLLARRMMG